MAVYQPVLGWHNCPANLECRSEGIFSEEKEDDFETSGFVLAGEHTPKNLTGNFRIGFDKMPTFQNDDFWNLPEGYKNIIYPDCTNPSDCPNSITVNGKYYEYHFDGKIEKWCLI